MGKAQRRTKAQLQAQAKLRLRRQSRNRDESLLEAMPRMTPKYMAPRHLARYAEILENAIGTTTRACVSVPPRHGKTELILHAVPYLLQKDPTITIGYASYSASLARSKSRRARDLCLGEGIALSDDMANLNEWRTKAGGGMLAGGVGGAWTGHGLDLLIVDDPIKNRKEAESFTVRETIHEWYSSTAYTRLEPTGSVIVNMTRWHPDDLIGRLLEGEEHFEEINFPALDEETATPLWPERWTAEQLQRVKSVNEYDWHSLWMGQPRRKGAEVFQGVFFYDELPAEGYRIGRGTDLAYSKNSRADASTLVIMSMEGRDPATATFYVEDVVAKRVEAPDFWPVLRASEEAAPGSPLVFRYAGAEKGHIDTMNRMGIKVLGVPTTGDKFVNAQELATAWNEGRVLVPRFIGEGGERAPKWVKPFVDELHAFTGLGEVHDDMVDGAISAHLACVKPPRVVFL